MSLKHQRKEKRRNKSGKHNDKWTIVHMFSCIFISQLPNPSVPFQIYLLYQAEDTGRELRQKKQDRYAEMQRRKDEEREAQERLMVGDFDFLSFCSRGTIYPFIKQIN